jgi:hypothetical protein
MIREELIKIMRDEGYDIITACEEVTRLLDELKSKPKGRYGYFVGCTEFTLRKD